MDVKIEESWKKRLADEFEKDYFKQLTDFVKQEYRQGTVYPPGPYMFNAFEHCPFDKVKVVILGQDPYHEPGQAHGLCFSVQDGVPFPPSLINIFKEIQDDLGHPVPTTGNLIRWADQGVLLLNATLTVRHIVYILWGSYAQKKGAFIDSSRNLVLKSAHPSPLSAYRGFFGNKHFSKANDYLIATGQTPIEW